MEKVILSKRNRHRAAVVKNINHPKWGDWVFVYRANGDYYQHAIEIGGERKELHSKDFNNYEVVSWKYDITLDEYWDLAMRAFNWTSFDPEKRGARAIMEHERELNDDLKDMPEEEKERYISNYKKYFSAWLSACSNCVSSAITGGSGFNTRRAEAANNREHARMEDFIQWREKALKAITKRREEARPESEKRNEAWKYLERDILSSAATIHGINTGIERGYHKALFVSSIFNKVETYAKKGDIEMVQRAIDCIRNFNKTMSVVVTERHKFFKLLEVAEANKEKIEDKATKENTEVPFKGGKIVNNFQENRIQLIFDEKPSADIISQLKKNGMKWSPRFGAWQRQMTGNAVYAVNSFLKSNNLIKSKP
ncbi:MAG: hypothetical protein LBH60_04850 [Prevotellaceae bacterium]|jgi:hypothetical protein|nr:hypothetical protein [Prevotellaceae bacterium]